MVGVPDKFQVLFFSNDAHERLSLLFPERNSINFSEVSKPIQWLALGRQIKYGPIIFLFPLYVYMCHKECQGGCKYEWKMEVSFFLPGF